VRLRSGWHVDGARHADILPARLQACGDERRQSQQRACARLSYSAANRKSQHDSGRSRSCTPGVGAHGPSSIEHIRTGKGV
jgi:hypothetical protein